MNNHMMHTYFHTRYGFGCCFFWNIPCKVFPWPTSSPCCTHSYMTRMEALTTSSSSTTHTIWEVLIQLSQTQNAFHQSTKGTNRVLHLVLAVALSKCLVFSKSGCRFFGSYSSPQKRPGLNVFPTLNCCCKLLLVYHISLSLCQRVATVPLRL